MKYFIGQKLVFHMLHSPDESVTVESLRKRGHAKLSNGWVVDEDGTAEGTQTRFGGYVTEAAND